ncbi:MAG: sulfite exporter TauE/SafE family protein, partial [Thermoleophilia bacterium]|nr:sulfite exporter TauE/SafE family protein [Thermoleophilia bacterium]
MIDLLLLLLTGVLAGAVNAVAGGGSLLSFPVLIATGLPPLTANVTNTVAQMPGYLSIVEGYRPDLRGQGPRIRALIAPTLIGALAGVGLLALGGDETFEVVVPWLILGACALLAVQPRLAARLRARTEERTGLSAPLVLAVAAGAAYASYFGAAAGVLLLAILAAGISDRLQRLNALNRFLVLIANAIAVPALILVAPVDWASVAVLAPATLVGGAIGARLARRLPDNVLR